MRKQRILGLGVLCENWGCVGRKTASCGRMPVTQGCMETEERWYYRVWWTRRFTFSPASCVSPTIRATGGHTWPLPAGCSGLCPSPEVTGCSFDGMEREAREWGLLYDLAAFCIGKREVFRSCVLLCAVTGEWSPSSPLCQITVLLSSSSCGICQRIG